MKSLKLSILVLSTHTRRNTFLPKSLDMIYGQLERSIYKDEVEVLYLIDNKCMTVGDKRNKLKSIASGEYIVFVDDDDIIIETYINDLIEAMIEKPDVISFDCQLNDNGKIKNVFFSTYYLFNFKYDDNYYRIPNHLMCIKRNIFNLVQFKDISLGEDNDVSLSLRPLLITEKKINKILYIYEFNWSTTETQ